MTNRPSVGEGREARYSSVTRFRADPAKTEDHLPAWPTLPQTEGDPSGRTGEPSHMAASEDRSSAAMKGPQDRRREEHRNTRGERERERESNPESPNAPSCSPTSVVKTFLLPNEVETTMMDDSRNSELLLSTHPNPNPSAADQTKKKRPAAPPKRFVKTQIPAAILSDPALNAAISLLPANYNFEVHKTVHRVLSASARRVALQLPDGLLMYALPLADILRVHAAAADVLVLAEPTYGACCLGDRAASALGADLLVHYGHSCLVPVTAALLPCLYVFVDIRIDAPRLAAAVRSAFPSPSSAPRLALAGTVQFVSAVHAARSLLSEEGYEVVVPQAKPLSAGEVLGCTAPTIPRSKGVEAVIFVADGRFHLEAFMIANPSIRAFRYDPYLGVLVLEEYDHHGMKRARKDAILAARGAKQWGVILGTLGRQGSTRVLDRVLEHMEERGLEYTVVLMSEITPARIALFGDSVDAWVQIACPRLSIDWGEGFTKPLLTTFEMEIALGYIPGWWEKERRPASTNSNCEHSAMKEKCASSGGCGSGSCGCNCDSDGVDYPMDYYAQDGGDWSSSYVNKKSSSIEAKAKHGTFIS